MFGKMGQQNYSMCVTSEVEQWFTSQVFGSWDFSLGAIEDKETWKTCLTVTSQLKGSDGAVSAGTLT